MNLFLLRHGDAETYSERDFDRALTEKGIFQIEKISKSLLKHDEHIDCIITSPLKRALETAGIVAGYYNLKDVLNIDERLSCGTTISQIEDLVRGYMKYENIMLVGHAPDLGIISSEILGLADEIDIKKGGLVKIKTSIIRPCSGKLDFYIYPGLL